MILISMLIFLADVSCSVLKIYDFWYKGKMYNFDPYNVLLAIATNIAVLLMTASVLQGHILSINIGLNLNLFSVK